jgi:hypothetical protein
MWQGVKSRSRSGERKCVEGEDGGEKEGRRQSLGADQKDEDPVVENVTIQSPSRTAVA